MNDWPQGLTLRPIDVWPGTMTRTRVVSPFSAPLRTTLKALHKELEHVKAKNVVMQIALEETQFRNDGYPRATAKPEHPGIILAMETPDGAYKLPCDAFITWQENLRAIVLTMERLRAVGRYGVVKHGEQYAGWKALDAPRTAPAGFENPTDAMVWLLEFSRWDSWDTEQQPSDLRFDARVAFEEQQKLIGRRRQVVRAAKKKAHPDLGGTAEDFQRVSVAEALLRSEGWI